MKFKIFSKISQLDDFAIELAKKLIKAGSTTVDDKVIARLIASGIIAIAASLSWGVANGGTILLHPKQLYLP